MTVKEVTEFFPSSMCGHVLYTCSFSQ